MSHKRYRSPHRGYSRGKHRAGANVAMEEELYYDDDLDLETGSDSIAALMGATDGPEVDLEPPGPPATPVAPEPRPSERNQDPSPVHPASQHRPPETPPESSRGPGLVDRILSLLHRSR